MKCRTLIIVLTVLASSACSTAKPRVVVPPVNPDLAAVVTPVKRASETTAKASASVKTASASATRAISIADKLVAPGQEAQVAQLKLELKTTVDELTVTTAQLDAVMADLVSTLAKTSILQMEVNKLRDQVIEEQKIAADERQAADLKRKELARVAKQRDLFVWIIAILGTIAVLLGLKDIISKVAQSFGPYAPLAAIALWTGVTAGSMLGFFALCQVLLDLVIK